MKWTIARALLCLAAAGCQPTGSPATSAADLERELRERVEQAYDFSRPGALERMLSLYPPDGAVSASGGAVVAGPDSLRAGIRDFWENVGVNMRDARWEWEEVHVVQLGPDGAALTGTWSIPHIAPTGRPHVIRGAWTAVFQRKEGQWYIVQEHLSTPD